MSTSHTEAVAPQPPQVNPGEVLRCAREERGLQLSEVANQLNLTSHVLSQIEAGDFHRLPGHTFARGYVRAYAKLLGIDANTLVESFDRYTGSDATAGSAVKGLKQLREPIRLSRILLRGFSGLLLVLLLLAGYSWWQDRPGRLADLGLFGLKHIEVDSADGVTQRHPVDEPEPTAPPTQTLALNNAQQPTPTATDSSTTSNPLPPGATHLPLPAAQANTPPALAPAAPTPPPEPPKPALPEGHGLIHVEYNAACWTKITDANGKVLFVGVRKKGETLDLSGKAPLDIRFGYARAVVVHYNNEPVEVDTSPSGKGRLNVGQ